MDEVTDPVLNAVRAQNPRAGAMVLEVYANAVRVYVEAADNVKRLGAVCAHPRTGAPVENPYLKVQIEMGKVVARMRAIRGDGALTAAWIELARRQEAAAVDRAIALARLT